jgi:hypothetical protein
MVNLFFTRGASNLQSLRFKSKDGVEKVVVFDRGHGCSDVLTRLLPRPQLCQQVVHPPRGEMDLSAALLHLGHKILQSPPRCLKVLVAEKVPSLIDGGLARKTDVVYFHCVSGSCCHVRFLEYL